MAAFIEFRDVFKAFNGKPVLRGLTLSVEKGEILVILGASGSGKSVMLRHILGLVRPDSGEVLVEGVDVTRLGEAELMPVRRKVGMLFQQGALFDSMTVLENVAFPLRAHTTLDDDAIRDRVREKLGLVELPGTEDLLPSALSGGMRKRVALARSIAADPEAILYDEPTTGLDPVTGHHITTLIRSTARTLGVTTLVVTHDIDSAFLAADRIAFLEAGVIQFVGTRAEASRTGIPSLREFLSAYGGKHGVGTG